MTEHEKYKELKKGFNKVLLKRTKWKNKYYHFKRRFRLAYKFIELLEEGIHEKVSHETLQKILDDYHMADRNITTLNKIQNEYRRNLNGKRKRSR